MLLQKDYSIIRQCSLKAGVELVGYFVSKGETSITPDNAPTKALEWAEVFDAWVHKAANPTEGIAEVAKRMFDEPMRPFSQPNLPAPIPVGQCPVCEGSMHIVPAGTSRRTGKPYRAFWGCDSRECNGKRNLDGADSPY